MCIAVCLPSAPMPALAALVLACAIVSLSEPKPTEELLGIASALIEEANQLKASIPENTRRLTSNTAQRVAHGGLVNEFADGGACLGTDQSQPLMTSSEEDGTAACRCRCRMGLTCALAPPSYPPAGRMRRVAARVRDSRTARPDLRLPTRRHHNLQAGRGRKDAHRPAAFGEP